MVAQKTLVKQTTRVSIKSKNETLFSNKETSRPRCDTSKRPEKGEPWKKQEGANTPTKYDEMEIKEIVK